MKSLVVLSIITNTMESPGVLFPITNTMESQRHYLQLFIRWNYSSTNIMESPMHYSQLLIQYNNQGVIHSY